MNPYVQPAMARHRRGRAPIGRGAHAHPPPPSAPYFAFIAYSSIPAARHALAQTSRLVRAHHGGLTLQPMLWRCDQLDHPRWREMALWDAARADVLVLALGGTAPFAGSSTEIWLMQLATRARGTRLTAFVFMEDDEGWTISLQARAQRPPAPFAQLRTSPVLAAAPHLVAAAEAEAARAA